jgi:hypothetical protein
MQNNTFEAVSAMCSNSGVRCNADSFAVLGNSDSSAVQDYANLDHTHFTMLGSDIFDDFIDDGDNFIYRTPPVSRPASPAATNNHVFNELSPFRESTLAVSRVNSTKERIACVVWTKERINALKQRLDNVERAYNASKWDKHNNENYQARGNSIPTTGSSTISTKSFYAKRPATLLDSEMKSTLSMPKASWAVASKVVPTPTASETKSTHAISSTQPPTKKRKITTTKRADLLPVTPAVKYLGFEDIERDEANWEYKGWSHTPVVHKRKLPLRQVWQKKDVVKVVEKLIRTKSKLVDLLEHKRVKGNPWMDKNELLASCDHFKLNCNISKATKFGDPLYPYVTCSRSQMLEERTGFSDTKTAYHNNKIRQLRVCPVYMQVYKAIATAQDSFSVVKTVDATGGKNESIGEQATAIKTETPLPLLPDPKK